MDWQITNTKNNYKLYIFKYSLWMFYNFNIHHFKKGKATSFSFHYAITHNKCFSPFTKSIKINAMTITKYVFVGNKLLLLVLCVIKDNSLIIWLFFSDYKKKLIK